MVKNTETLGNLIITDELKKIFKRNVQVTYENMLIEDKTKLKDIEFNLLGEYGKSAKVGNPNAKKRVIYKEEEDQKSNQMGAGNKSTKKIRKLIQKHFLSDFPWSLKITKIMAFDFVLI